VSFKTGPEDCYGRCGSDKIRQTVPNTCNGDQESSVTNGIGSLVRLTINDEEELDGVADEPRHLPPDIALQMGMQVQTRV